MVPPIGRWIGSVLWPGNGAHSQPQNQKPGQCYPADVDVPSCVLALYGERPVRTMWTCAGVHLHAYRQASDMVPGQQTGGAECCG